MGSSWVFHFVLEFVKAKCKGSGKGGRPKGSTNRLKLMREIRVKNKRQCRLCLSFGHDARSCPTKDIMGKGTFDLSECGSSQDKQQIKLHLVLIIHLLRSVTN